MSNLHKNQKGSVIILVALAMIGLIGFMALALEVGFMYVQKTRLQSTADAAALACLIKSTTCGSGGLNQFPEVNFYQFTVNTTYPVYLVFCSPLNTQTTCAQAVASTTWNSFFGGFLGVPRTFSLAATAIARNHSNVPSCLITTGNFSANGNNAATLNNCSASIGGSLSTTQNGKIIVQNFGGINVFNGGSASGCTNCSPTPVSVSGPIPNLPSSTFPTTNIGGASLPELDYTKCTDSQCVPGIYSGVGPVTLTSDTTLKTGNYVFNSGFDNGGKKLTSGVGGVSLYILGTTALNLSSGIINLTAPSSVGCTAGSEMVISHPYVANPIIKATYGRTVRLVTVTSPLHGLIDGATITATLLGTNNNYTITLVDNNTFTFTTTGRPGSIAALTPMTYKIPDPSYNSMNLNGSIANLTLNGVVNLSADNIDVSGTSANINISGSLVAHSVDLNGNMMPTLSSNPCFNLYEPTGKPILVD